MEQFFSYDEEGSIDAVDYFFGHRSTEDTSSNDGVAKADRASLYCTFCDHDIADEDVLLLPDVDTNRERKYCPACVAPIGRGREEQTPRAAVVLGKKEPHDESVSRSFTSRYGKVKLHISWQSYFAGFVRMEGAEPEVCCMLRQLINEEFSLSARDAMWRALKKSKMALETIDGALIFSQFVRRLQAIVAEVHADRGKTLELDYDKVTSRAG